MQEKHRNDDKEELIVEKTPKAKKSNFDRSDLISILAVLLSLGALGVAIIQANIMRDQQDIMVTQQRSSVLPYLIPNTKINLTVKDGIDYKEFTLSITNKGFGPALINNINLKYNDKLYNEGSRLLLDFTSNLDSFSLGGMTIGDFNNVFLSPGEKHTVFNILIDQKQGQTLEFIPKLNLEYDFCSILEECWVSKNGETKLVE